MAFYSILSESSETEPSWISNNEPSCFGDLNLNQIVNAITAGREEYNLKPFFYTPLEDIRSIQYRQQIVLDLDQAAMLDAIQSFAVSMQAMRGGVDEAKKLYYKHFKERRFVAAVENYCLAVEQLAQDLLTITIRSEGMKAFREFLNEHVTSSPFRDLQSDIAKVKAYLSRIKYCLRIKDGAVTVLQCEGECDYSTAVEKTFAKFRRDEDKKHPVKIRRVDGINHIQEQILDRLALFFPGEFQALEEFSTKHADYLNETISRFDREIQFYVAYLIFIEKFRNIGLKFSLPLFMEASKEVMGSQVFDLALACKLLKEGVRLICNDFFLKDPERIFIISGPNQGGKTTFARTFGQMHYLGCLGCLVPGVHAELFLIDRISTHFEREETITNLRGKLEDDLIRIHQILGQATPRTLIILNEIFASTTLKDAIYLSKRVISAISALDALAVCVTFLDELATFNEKTVSFVSTIYPDKPMLRTYKLERRPADGLAYALAIAQKYRVSYESIKERIRG